MKNLCKRLLLLVTLNLLVSPQINAQEEFRPIKDLISTVGKTYLGNEIKSKIIEILQQFPEDNAVGVVGVDKSEIGIIDKYIILAKVESESDSCGYHIQLLGENSIRYYIVTCIYGNGKNGEIVNATLYDGGLPGLSSNAFFFDDAPLGVGSRDLLDFVAPDGKTKSFIGYPDNTWIKQQESGVMAAFYIPGTTTALDAVKELVKSRSLPDMQLVNSDVVAANVYKGTELVKELLSDKRKKDIAIHEEYIKKKEAEKKKREKENSEAYEILCKRFGKKYVDASIKGNLIIGLPIDLFLRALKSGRFMRVTSASLSTQTGSKKIYKMYGPTAYNTSSGTTLTTGFVGWVTFTNGKLTSISWR